jgi:hypothetical protein
MKTVLVPLAVLLSLVVLSPVARAQQVTVDIDQAALTKIIRKEVGDRWVLVELRGAPRLVIERPEATVTPGGVYLAGLLKSTSPDLSTPVEIRFQPVIREGILRIDPASLTVTRPTGMLGFMPRKILGAWLQGDTAREEIRRFQVDLRPLVKHLGGSSRSTLALRLAFGRISLLLTLR